MIRTDRLEKTVMRALFERILTEENLTEVRKEVAKREGSQGLLIAARMRGLEESVQEAARGVERLVDALEQAGDSEAILKRLKKREVEVAEVKERLEEARIAERAYGEGGGSAAGITELREKLKAVLATGPPKAVRRVLERVIVQILVDEEVLRIQYRYPFL